MVTLSRTIPALPVRDATVAAVYYRDRLGFATLHHDGGFAIVARDDAVIHLWEASDESWRERDSMEDPVRSGAESFIAGTASCRVEVEGVDELYAEFAANDVLHYADSGSAVDTDFGTREFATTDQDNNLITFFHRTLP